MKRIALFACLAATSVALNANGTRLPYQDMDAVARGYAFAATADTPAAIYYNPAGIAQQANGAAQAGVAFLRPETSFAGARAPRAEAETRTFTLPYVFATQPVNVGASRPFVVGAAMYAPFGLSSEWDPSSTGFRTLATRNALVFRRYALSMATRLSPDLMIGGSLQYNRVHFDLNRGIGYVPNDRINLTGRGEGWSYNAGLLYQPMTAHSFGIQYQAPVDLRVSGKTSYTPAGFGGASTAKWPFPANYTVSYSCRISSEWNIEVGYDRTGWSRVGTVQVNRAASGPLPLVFGWKDSSYYEFGGTRSWASGWRVSAGGCWSGNSIPDNTFNPTVVDYDRWLWNAGIGYRAGRWKLGSLVQWSPRRTRSVNGSLRSPAGESADGAYTGKLTAAGFQAVVGW